MKQLTIVVAACIARFAAFGAPTVYENDFATRTSAGAVPYDGWRSVRYVAGELLVNTNYLGASAFVEDDLQDNWLKAPNTSLNNAYIDDLDGSGNYVARLGDDLPADKVVYDANNNITSAESGHVIAIQRLGNTFSNGTLTVTFDMRPPKKWWYYTNKSDSFNERQQLRFCVLGLGNDGMYAAPWARDHATNELIQVGASLHYLNDDEGWSRYAFINANESVRFGRAISAGRWLRYVVNVDLDSATWGFDCYDIGLEAPSLDTPIPATPHVSTNGLAFVSTDMPKTISTIAIGGYAVRSGDSAALFDNIRVAHNGVECYVNEFTERRSRSLAESSSAYSHAVSTSLLVDQVSYPKTNNVLYVDEEDSTYYNAAGFDGWKRRSKTAAELAIEANNQYLTFDLSDKSGYMYSVAAHPMGIKATSGTVRFRGDLRMPSKWWWENNKQVFFILGGDVFYKATSVSGSESGKAVRVGLSDSGVYYRNQVNGINYVDNKELVLSKWYRIYITVDLDSRTFGYEVYYKGGQPSFDSTETEEDLVSSATGLTCLPDTGGLSCFGIAAYGGTSPRFDNFRISHTPSGSSEEFLVYRSTCTVRNIYRAEDPLTGTIRDKPTGIDGWTRLGTSENGVRLVGGENPAIGFGNGDETYATAVHGLGGLFKKGTMSAQIDVRAPSSWQDCGGCANIWFGGDQYHEGNLNGGEYNYEKMAAFGFGITNTAFSAFRGDRAGGGSWETSGETTAGNWYRFVVSVEGNASDVSVYDMGAEQPTLSTATPDTPVATFADLPFRRGVGEMSDITCVGVSAMGVKNPSWSHLVPGGEGYRLMIDNIRVGYAPDGTVIIFR